MNIIIVGCGKVGQTLAAQLNEEGNNITVVDTDAARVNRLATQLDVMGVTGNGATHAVQSEAGVENADLLIAVTGSDELNMLCCLIAHKESRCKTIARIKKPEYGDDIRFLQEELGLAMVVNPEQAAAAEIARILRFPSAIKIDTFAKGRVELLKFRLPEGSPLIGKSVRDIVAKLGCDVLICTVERGEQAYIANGDLVFADRDVISLIASPRNASEFFRRIGYKIRSVKDVMIAGGGEIAHYLTEMLRRAGIAVKIIEKNPQVCEELSARWQDVAVVCGDASVQDLLLEENIAGAGAFVALTSIDEENILLSLFAKRVGHGKVITKINRIDFASVIAHLDLDSTIYPKHITADQIERYARAAANTLGIQVSLPAAIVLSAMSALGACGASGVAGGSLLLIPMACSLFGISNDVAMQMVGVGFIIGVVQDSVETALNSAGDVEFAATAEYHQWLKQGKPLPEFLHA